MYKKPIYNVAWFWQNQVLLPHTQNSKHKFISYEKKKVVDILHSFLGINHNFYVRTTDVTGEIESFRLDDDSELKMVMPGDRIKVIVQLIEPIAIEKGMRFAIREGNRTVGAGLTLKVIT